MVSWFVSKPAAGYFQHIVTACVDLNVTSTDAGSVLPNVGTWRGKGYRGSTEGRAGNWGEELMQVSMC